MAFATVSLTAQWRLVGFWGVLLEWHSYTGKHCHSHISTEGLQLTHPICQGSKDIIGHSSPLHGLKSELGCAGPGCASLSGWSFRVGDVHWALGDAQAPTGGPPLGLLPGPSTQTREHKVLESAARGRLV